MSDTQRVRIDKWLWAARFFKTRSLATRAIDLGRVRIDGERIKPAHDLSVGEHVEIQQELQRIEVIVRALAQVRGPAPAARELYEETPESNARRTRLIEARRFGTEPARALKGRPTKKEGRLLRQARQDD